MLSQTIEVLMQHILWHGSKDVDTEPAKQHAVLLQTVIGNSRLQC